MRLCSRVFDHNVRVLLTLTLADVAMFRLKDGSEISLSSSLYLETTAQQIEFCSYSSLALPEPLSKVEKTYSASNRAASEYCDVYTH
jgi:hypothetical protein